MRCILGFFGITRSLRFTAAAIRENFFAPLSDAGIATVRVGHFNMPGSITNPRSGEMGLTTDRAEAGLLDLDLCWIEAQSDVVIQTELEIASVFPDPFGDNYRSLRNLCRQLHSLRRLWALIQLLKPSDDDVVLFLRPDLLYLDPLRPSMHLAPLLERHSDLVVPAWQSWGGVNDRFAFCNGRSAGIYASRIELLADGCVTLGTLHSESFLAFVLRRGGCRASTTDLRALRVRANGCVCSNDVPLLAEAGIPAAAVSPRWCGGAVR